MEALKNGMDSVCACLSQYLPFKSGVLTVGGMTLRVKESIGEGGYSFVSLAQDTKTGRTYALKKTNAQTPEQLKEAVHEVDVFKALNRKNSVHILRMHESCVKTKPDDISEVYIVLDYHQKGSMQEIVEEIGDGKREPYSERECLTLFLGVCEAVLAMHTNEPAWSHNDLKPANILLSDNEKCVLLDFGSVSSARVVVKSRVQAMQVQDFLESHSTPGYRAPELFDVASDCVLDERTDVWSLGCILFAFAFGESPFETSVSEMGGSLSLAVMSGRFKFPDSHGFSSDFIELITSMLQTDISRRPYVPDVVRQINSLL